MAEKKPDESAASADKKPAEPAASADIVQRYRFRVRTADGRELISHVATVTRPAPAVTAAPVPAQQLIPERSAVVQPVAPTPEKAPPLVMIDVPVHKILVAVTGVKQGEFKVDVGFTELAGEAAKHQCEIDQFSFGVKTPRDPQSGLPTGQRMYDPVAFVKAKGASSTQFYNALVTNEALMVVIFDCYGQDPKSGKIVLAHSVKLTNASVASIGFQMPNLRDPALMKYTDTETITLTFQKVELTGAGGVTAADSWEAQS
jgi:type VI secretion system secreted protein Hcp